MSRRVKEFVDVEDHVSIDELIEKLTELRDSLPDSADAELRLRGDEVFGHKLTISYFREQTAEEVELDSKYARDDPESANIDELRRKLDEVPFKLRKRNNG